MTSIPRASGIDNSIPLLREGYTFISNRCDALDTDIFRTRLMGRRVTCVRGASAAEMFYHPDRFTRRRALPPTTIALLQDFGSVMLLDGDAHRHRKAMFMDMMTPDRLERLTAIADEEWRAGLARWQRRPSIVLFDEARDLLCRTVCRWAGAPLSERDARARSRELGSLVDGAGSPGPRNWWGQLQRRRVERWAQAVITQARAGEIHAPEDSAVSRISQHRTLDGKLLDVDTAAVELINILRPIVAVTRYLVFEAVAMHEHPEAREFVRSGSAAEVESFVHEVRRFYPFFPFIGGRARQPIEWEGHRFKEGDWVILDLYGTLHEARLWKDPQVFRPERFIDWQESPYTLIPQGGGDHHTTHRCPGEWPTIRLMTQAATFLARETVYDVPTQDLTIALSHMPARPKSGFIMRKI